MKKVTFNLNKFMKKAYYEDAKGLMQPLTRGWMNCYKYKMEKGMGHQEAMLGCLKEFQKHDSNDWDFKYAKNKKNQNK